MRTGQTMCYKTAQFVCYLQLTDLMLAFAWPATDYMQ